MPIKILYDPFEGVAMLADTIMGWAFGPIFTGDDAEEDARAFIDSLEHDPAGYTENELRSELREWRKTSTNGGGP